MEVMTMVEHFQKFVSILREFVQGKYPEDEAKRWMLEFRDFFKKKMKER